MNQYQTEDLTIDLIKGIAYQVDRKNCIEYNDEYFAKVKNKTKKKVINDIRCNIVNKHTPSGKILDVGCGDLSFIDHIGRAYGYDIMPKTRDLLKEEGIYCDPYIEIPKEVKGITCWDSLEHMPEPSMFLARIKNQRLYVSIPIIEDLRLIRQWTHYRPNEHLFYFTNNGFLDWMNIQGFRCINFSEDEQKAGREDISTFVFER